MHPFRRRFEPGDLMVQLGVPPYPPGAPQEPAVRDAPVLLDQPVDSGSGPRFFLRIGWHYSDSVCATPLQNCSLLHSGMQRSSLD